MKRPLSTILFFALCQFAVVAQSNPTIDALIDPLAEDINAFADSICGDLAPELFQLAMAGDTVGAAAFDGDFPHGTVIFPAFGACFGNGIGTVLNDPSHVWKFMTPLPTLIKNATGSSNDLYDATRKVVPYPFLALGLGFGITKDFEILCSGMLFPQSLTDSIVGMTGSKQAESLKPRFSTGSIVLKVRKVFFRDSKKWPAMSVSLGGAYGSTEAGATIDLRELTGSDIAFSNIGTLNLTGPIDFNASVIGVGMEFAVSKKFLIFVPFARTGIWYRHSTVSSNFDLLATVYDTDGTTALTTKAIKVSPSRTNDAIAGRIGGGLELRMAPIVFHISADFDLEQPLVDISSLSMTGIALEGVTVKTGFRIAF